jgi:hypothetical protein
MIRVKDTAFSKTKSILVRLRGKERTQAVRCKVCGVRYVALTHSHLAKHGLTASEYKKAYGVEYLCSEETRFRISARNQKMTPESILDIMSSMARSGKRLYASEVQKRYPSLYFSASHAFGTWLRAMEAAGLDPEKHSKRNSRYCWNRKRIVAEIKKRHAAGLRMNGHAVGQDQKRLYSAARNHFAGWRNALAAAGIDPDMHSPKRKWSPDRIIRAILERTEANRPLAQAEVARDNMSLYQAACNYFGNWSKALEAGGFSSWSITRRKPWTRELVVKAILRDYRRGLAINYGAVKQRDRQLVNAARSKLGSWDHALRAAGLDPQEHRQRRPFWKREELIASIREMCACGEKPSLRYSRSRSVYEASIRQFGSWQAALDEAMQKTQDE